SQITSGNTGNVDSSTATEFNPWLDVDQSSGSVNLLYYTTAGDPSGNNSVHPRVAVSVDGGSTFAHADVSVQTSDENGGNPDDYGEYNGLVVHDGTLHAIWGSRVSVDATHPYSYDLEALYANASILSLCGDNVLTVTGDDGGVPTGDEIVVA